MIIPKHPINKPSKTLVYLDICTLTHIEKYLEGEEQEQDVESKLRKYDKPYYVISYITAFIEKSSKPNSNDEYQFDKSQLIASAKSYLATLKNFFNVASIYEDNPDNSLYIDCMITAIRGGIHANKKSDYHLEHDFLTSINKIGLHQPIAQEKKFSFATKIIEKAKEIELCLLNPVVIASIACVYDCKAARGVMKFKQKPEKFQCHNSYSDVKTITITREYFDKIAINSDISDYIYITDDEDLQKLHSYFMVPKNEIGIDINISFSFPDLFFSLYDKNGHNFNSEDSKNEANKLLELLSIPNNYGTP